MQYVAFGGKTNIYCALPTPHKCISLAFSLLGASQTWGVTLTPPTAVPMTNSGEEGAFSGTSFRKVGWAREQFHPDLDTGQVSQ